MPTIGIIDIIFAFIAVFADIYGFVVTIAQIRKGFNYRFYQYAVITWLIGLIEGITVSLGGISSLLPSVEISKMSEIFALGVNFFILLMYDALKREQVDPVKVSAYLVLSAFVFFTMFNIPDWGTSPWALLYLVPESIPLIYSFYCSYLVVKRAPTALKRISKVFATGAFLGLAAPVVSIILWSEDWLLILVSLSVVMCVYAYIREPKLLFVLPFTALRLMVIDTSSGLALFNHTWNTDEKYIDDDIFSSLIQGLGLFAAKAIGKGQIREMALDKATLIIHRLEGTNIACVVITTRSSKTLRDALQIFTKKFSNRYKAELAAPSDTDQFAGANALVEESFPFVPVYN
ncbi:MAG TPA: hypothetical protein VKK79_15520 [Candidatus Lokiarchaeia archaeon]|nr:hypothetical protein [Candidatus Lokiarchaeia archaeon]